MKEDTTRVNVLTSNYRIEGNISLARGARLTDYMDNCSKFIAVTDAVVQDKMGNVLLETNFLNINTEHIEIIMPTA